jgi:hypothetical protein
MMMTMMRMLDDDDDDHDDDDDFSLKGSAEAAPTCHHSDPSCSDASGERGRRKQIGKKHVISIIIYIHTYTHV